MNSQRCGGLRKSWSAPFFVVRNLIVIGLVLCSCGMARADWSPEIVLWENPEDISPGEVEAALDIDEEGNVHILYEGEFRHPQYPFYIVSGLYHVKYDDHGNQLSAPIMINDSLEHATGRPQIGFFGRDSLWVSWYAYHELPPAWTGFRARTLTMDGDTLGGWRDWPERDYGIMSWHAFVVSHDRLAVFVYADTNEVLRCVVQRPDGSRIMDHTVIWNVPTCDVPDSRMIEDTDSLMLAWRQRGDGWDAVYSKRINIAQPFDTNQIQIADTLTPAEPGSYWSGPDLLPRVDSLLAMVIGGPPGFGTGYLFAYRRATMSRIADATIGFIARRWSDFDGPSEVSLFAGQTGDSRLYFRRYGWPSLSLVQDSIFLRPGPVEAIGPRAYAVSRDGVRHVVYARATVNHLTLIYRYWRSDLGIGDDVPERADQEYRIWPNPVSADLVIEGPLERLRRIVIYNVLGQTVVSVKPGSGRTLALPSEQVMRLPNGPYFLMLQGADRSMVRKFIVTH